MSRVYKFCTAAAIIAAAVILFTTAGQEPEKAVEAVSGQKTGTPAYYEVKEGDSLWGIARRFRVNVFALAETNGLDPARLDQIYIGQILTLPGQGGKPKASPAKRRPRISFTAWPVRGTVSSAFGPRDGATHEGLDIAADKGRAIRALAGGVVVFAGPRGNYGKTVIINHGKGIRTLYAHASRLEVEAGQRVESGQVIARVGSTGHSTGPHLHLEVLYRGTPLNPVKYLPKKEEGI